MSAVLAYLLKFLPFLSWAKNTTSISAQKDAVAGLTGAIIVLPQGVAYALIAGLPPEYGLYAAIVPAIVAALFGSSWHLISGPTAALSIVVFTTISPLAEAGSAAYISLVLTLTLLAGLFQLVLSLARMGSLVNFVSHSVVVGFTSGAAVVIATSQIKNALGLDLKSSGNFMLNWLSVGENISSTHLPSLLIACLTLFTLIIVKRWRKNWPNMLIAMIVGSLATQALILASWSEATQIALVGEIPSQLPPLSAPTLTWDLFRQLAPGAMALGLLGLVEAVSISRSVATRSGQQIKGNQEFIGQAMSNIFGSFASSYATSGSFTRTGVNFETGATSPLAAIFAAAFLAVILVLFAPLAAFITLPGMAAILLMVSWNLIDLHHIKIIYRAGKNEVMVFSVTFLATLLLPMEFAIYLGVLLTLVLYLKRTSKPNIIALASSKGAKKLVDAKRTGMPECEAIKVIRIDGSLFFGAVDYVQTAMMNISQKHVLIVASGINFIDLAGTALLANEAKRLSALGGGLYLCNLNGRVIKPIIRNGHIQAIGKRHIFATKALALKAIDTKLHDHTCLGCENR